MAPRLCHLLALGLVSLVAFLAVAACGGGGDEPAGTTEPAQTEGETGDAAAGEAVWAEAGCGSCHTLAAAGSSGSVGPNLDELQPSFDATVEQVTNGGGGMPAFGDTLSEQQILDVSAFVAESTSG